MLTIGNDYSQTVTNFNASFIGEPMDASLGIVVVQSRLFKIGQNDLSKQVLIRGLLFCVSNSQPPREVFFIVKNIV